ncbi:MAG: type II toxin-antitoxin system VapC family toxin [Thermaerobacter sp.]|nr:type II toxin-antitoxin system VapC family toxin [Thermaerobacter sp.]
MKLLLDTHTFLWWITDDPQLSAPARKVISDSDNEVFFSAVSAWELAIKAGLGRLKLNEDLSEFVREQLLENRFIPLPLSLEHALRVRHLPGHHQDPFDRALVTQAQTEGMSLVSRDSDIRKYPIDVLW